MENNTAELRVSSFMPMKENNIAEFIKTGTEFFQFEKISEDDYNHKINNFKKYYSLKDEGINLIPFIRFEDAPFFWIAESPFHHYLNEYIKFNLLKRESENNFLLIKDFYSKWLTIKLENEKKYFAKSIISLHEKDPGRANFLSVIFIGIIYSFDPLIRDTEKGVKCFSSIHQICESLKLNDRIREELLILMDIYSGFAFLTINDFDNAKSYFLNALHLRKDNSTAKFYLAYVESCLSDYESAAVYLKEIYSADIKILESLCNNSFTESFNYFLNNPVIKNIFYYNIFSENISFLHTLIQDSVTGILITPKKIIDLIHELKKAGVEDYVSEDLNKDILFIEQTLSRNENTKNIFFLKMFPFICIKLKTVFENILNRIKQRFYTKIKEHVIPYDREIHEIQNTLNILSLEFEELKKQNHAKLGEFLNVEDDQLKEYIRNLEAKIVNLDSDKKHDPLTSFKNTMIYNMIISLLLSIMGGCAGYSTVYIKSNHELNKIFSVIILTGIKWGLIAFAVGAAISLGAAGFSLLDKHNHRQRLLNRIKSIKNAAEAEKERLKEKYRIKDVNASKSYNDKIDIYKGRIELLQKNRKVIEESLTTEANEKIKNASGPLIALQQKIG